jgi:hypothetical protein
LIIDPWQQSLNNRLVANRENGTLVAAKSGSTSPQPHRPGTLAALEAYVSTTRRRARENVTKIELLVLNHVIHHSRFDGLVLQDHLFPGVIVENISFF